MSSNHLANDRAGSVTAALQSRHSCRAFLSTPVAAGVVRNILDTARAAPSGGNLQPWQIFVLANEAIADFRARLAPRQAASPMGEAPGYDIYPPNVKEPYRSRRYKCGEDMYATIGVARDDKPARLRQFARNFNFFGAPVAMFFVLDRSMGPPQWSDVGMLIQSIMLLAREQGLDTCPQEAWTVWHQFVAEYLGLGPEQILFCGLSLGYRDASAPINTLRTDRAPLAECCTFLGF